MNHDKKARLEAAGWKVGSAAEFLNLTPDETALVEIRLALSQQLRSLREGHVTQAELAARMGSSQPRIAKAEAGDRSVSLDLLVRALLALGADRRAIGDAIAGAANRNQHRTAQPAHLVVRDEDGTYVPSASTQSTHSIGATASSTPRKRATAPRPKSAE